MDNNKELKTYKVLIEKDPESPCWYAHGDGWNGLNAVHGSFDALLTEVKLCISDLFETNEFTVTYRLDHSENVHYG
jgi:hypothetical protein